MTENIYVEKIDNTYLRVRTSADLIEELAAYFTFTIPNAQFNPLVKARRWDGKIRLFKKASQSIYCGLISDLHKFSAERGYNLTLDKHVVESFMDNSITKEYFSTFIKNLKMYDLFNNQKLKWKDYQLLALWQSIRHKRRTIISATGTGKSAFIYGACRFYQELQPNKILIVVPNIGLTLQMFNDFKSYAYEDEDWVVEENCEVLYGGQTVEGKQILISTWQSLMNQSSSFFAQFGAVVIDETHGAKAKEISTILENCVNAEYRLGTTGTLDGQEISELTIKGLIGPIFTVQTAKQAMDNGHLAKLNIECVVLNYNETDKKLAKNLKYQDELEFIFKHEPRQDYISEFVTKLKGNTLVLFSRIDHGKLLFEKIKALVGDDRKVYLVYGGVEASDREDIRGIVEKEKDAIIVASFGTMSTGTNIRNINNVVFAASSKSLIRVLQSIGRGLRKTLDKLTCRLFDIVDHISDKNYSYIHWLERIKIYESQEFEYIISEVNL